MLPPIVQRRVEYAQAVASNLRAVAAENPDLPTVAARFTQAARTIDEMVALLESATWVAKLNHDTIVEIGNERANVFQAACTHEGACDSRGPVDSRFDDARAGLEPI